MKYYYQKSKTPDRYLPDKWLCCGGVRDYGTPEEIEKSINFYLDYFAHKDTRDNTEGDYMVVIVDSFHGNVAGREELDHCEGNTPIYTLRPEIADADMLTKYNF